MTHLAVNDAQADFAAALERVAQTGERIILTREGQDLAVLVPLEDLALLEEIEDRLDVEAVREATAEWEREGRQTIPWEQVKADLGL